MRKVELDPRKIYAFHDVGRGKDLLAHVKENGWIGIPRVPIFEIPLEHREEGYEYILMDGNTRWTVAKFLNELLPCLLYDFGEKINVELDGLAPFKHSADPRVYDKILTFYLRRKEL